MNRISIYKITDLDDSDSDAMYYTLKGLREQVLNEWYDEWGERWNEKWEGNLELWDKKPITTIEVINEFETRVTYDNGAQKINNLNFGVIETNVEGNILLASHEAIVTKLSGLNPTAAFNIIDLLGSII